MVRALQAMSDVQVPACYTEDVLFLQCVRKGGCDEMTLKDWTLLQENISANFHIL